MALECLETLVGLAPTAPTCFVDPQPDGFDTSTSGYYILDPELGGNIINACNVEGWAVLARSRAKGILQFKTDLSAALRERFGSAISPFSGKVGELKSTGTKSVTKDYAGHRIRIRKQIKGGKIILKTAFLGVNTSGTYAVTVTSNDPLYTSPTAVNVSATANTFGTTGTTLGLIELPMWSDSCPYDYLEYYISYPLASATPLNNKISCGCGGNTEIWKKHLDISGFESDSQTPITGNFTSAAFGLVLDLYLSCGELDWICELAETGGDYMLRVIARTLQFAQEIPMIDELVMTYKVNVCTHYNEAEFMARRNYLIKSYANNIAFIAANVPDGATGCFACHPKKAFHRTAQLV